MQGPALRRFAPALNAGAEDPCKAGDLCVGDVKPMRDEDRAERIEHYNFIAIVCVSMKFQGLSYRLLRDLVAMLYNGKILTVNAYWVSWQALVNRTSPITLDISLCPFWWGAVSFIDPRLTKIFAGAPALCAFQGFHHVRARFHVFFQSFFNGF